MYILSSLKAWEKHTYKLAVFKLIFIIAPIFRLFYRLRHNDLDLANFKYKTGSIVTLRLISWQRRPKRQLKRLKRRNKALMRLPYPHFSFFYHKNACFFAAMGKVDTKSATLAGLLVEHVLNEALSCCQYFKLDRTVKLVWKAVC